ncbi:TPA: hypothetical protein N0F65_005374 [Lagenidium giganteum]|uniref:SF3 helicase domain-containing protein n=1 Tax=Lagenidium giganteum TaxID=4803 RepID=A0AAV2YM82_9STRA|nr:TPA: hypothetical protein N0F65_005374 [Lagenidium giganteum]
MCSATPCCWNHRGHVSKFITVVKPVVKPVGEAVVEPVVEPVVKPVQPVFEPAAEAVVEPVELVPEAAIKTVIKPGVEAVVKPVVEVVVDRNLEYEYNHIHRGRQYEYWIKKHASGVGHDAQVLQVIDGKGKNRRLIWRYSHVDRSAFVKFTHKQLKHECHEVFIGNRKIKLFIDCDQKLTNAEFNAYEMTTDELVLQIATDYMTAFKHAHEYTDCNFAIYEDDIDFLVTNRSRKMDGGVKLSTHIVTNNWIYCCGMQSYYQIYAEGIFHTNLRCRRLLHRIFKVSVDKPQDIFAESSNEFIDKAIQEISKIPDYDPSKLDVYGRAPKGNFVNVKRTGSSHCSVCDRIHESDDTMLLIFNEEKQFIPQVERKFTESQRLKLKLIKLVGDKYRRSYGSGAIYERQTDYFYSYKYSYPKIFLTMSLQISNHTSCRQRKNLTSCSIKLNIRFFQDHNYIGFSNEVYDLSTASYINATDVPKGIQNRKYINQKFDIIETPLFDKYFSFQFTEEEDREFIYFLIGRCLTVLDDNFMLMIHGQGGSGKSLLANIIKFAIGQDQIGLLSNSMQEKFGLSEFAMKQIVCCDDMPHNIAGTLPRSDFL